MDLNTAILKTSLERMKPIAGQVSDRFYEILWSDYPETRALFHNTAMGRQKFSFFNAISFIVDSLDKPEDLQAYLRRLGSAHVGYGVQDHHYGWVGVSLMKTFCHFAGDTWSDALAREWANAFSFISSMMLEGARERAPEVEREPSIMADAMAQQAARAAGLDLGQGPAVEKASSSDKGAEVFSLPPAAPASAPSNTDAATAEIPESVRVAIREGVREAIREAIREEVQNIAQEELDDLQQTGLRNYLKRAA